MSMKFLKTVAGAAVSSLWEKVSGNVVLKDSSASVGIGTDTPDVELQVVGDLKVGQDTASTLGSDMMVDIVNNTTGQALAVDQTGTLAANSAVMVLYSNADQDQANSPLFGAHLDNSGSTSPVMSLRQDGTGDVLQVKDGSETISFKIADGGDVTLGSGNLVIGTAGKGIDFSAQTATATGTTTAEVLNHYETGTWTGVITDGSDDATMEATATTGAYTRIGNLVTCTGFFQTSSLGSASGALQLKGLPFTIFNNNKNYSSLSAGYATSLDITAGENIGGYASVSAASIILTVWDDTGGITALTDTMWTANGRFMITFSYAIS